MNARMVFTVRGIVQGVGFRPFVLRKAAELSLGGYVMNTAEGVVIACEGEETRCLALAKAIKTAPPPGAMIFALEQRSEPPRGEDAFRILASSGGAAQAAVSPDLGICADCARELLDPADRRYRYPFLNCTACGPRFTILRRVPYDRVNTTMAKFAMCDKCAAEYTDPENRRFHAQPTACADCGPRLIWLEGGVEVAGDATELFQASIKAGRIVAVRGLGGYHLVCDAANEAAVTRMRALKRRYAKPFAIMVKDITEAQRLCYVNEAERELLLSPRKPILLLRKRADAQVASSVAPENTRLGVMLPYTPLHVLLTQNLPPLVMTSANVSDAPMPYSDEDLGKVSGLCDAVLTHNRPILRRMDDSVCVYAAGKIRAVRRARGFVPEPLPLEGAARDMLCFGAQLKNTFCLVRGGRAYISGHMGDLDDADAFAQCRGELDSFIGLFGGEPEALVHDLHPDYASTRLAQEWALRYPRARLIAVQHHQAHFASVLAENGLPRAQGFIFDGSGYGTDGTIWGGEMLVGGAASAQRVARLRPISLPGADAAVREPWRAAFAALCDACTEERAFSLFNKIPEAALMGSVLKSRALSPQSSGMGRLFDAVAAIAGLHPYAGFEGQAAIALEQAYDESAAGSYGFDVSTGAGGLIEWDWRGLVKSAVEDIPLGPGVISARFHRALAALISSAATQGEPVALSGGVFQNVRLLGLCTRALEAKGFKVYSNALVPANDGGISFGQAASAAAILNGGS